MFDVESILELILSSFVKDLLCEFVQDNFW